MGLRTLLIDNYDSYTYNLYQLIAQANEEFPSSYAEPPTVIYNDAIDIDTLLEQIHHGAFHNIVISPGPGTPNAPADIGLCLSLIQAQPQIPILGVCLGFQTLALAYGASVIRAHEPVHGRLSVIETVPTNPLFHGIPRDNSYHVVRYHSLMVDESTLPDSLQAIAWTTGGGHHALAIHNNLSSSSSTTTTTTEHVNFTKTREVTQQKRQPQNGERCLMAIAHTSLPYYGVQYHPESVGTAYGHELLRNFRNITEMFYANTGKSGHAVSNMTPPPQPTPFVNSPAQEQLQTNSKKFKLVFDQVSDASHLQQELFEMLIACDAADNNNGDDSFWLDTAAQDRGRFSFMGGGSLYGFKGPLWRRIWYDVDSKTVKSIAAASSPSSSSSSSLTPEFRHDVVSSFWDWLQDQLSVFEKNTIVTVRCHGVNKEEKEEELPFEFHGGFVGYLGYELKSECGGRACHSADAPDASFLFVDRFLAMDNATGSVYVVALTEATEEEVRDSKTWVHTTAQRIRDIAADIGGSMSSSILATVLGKQIQVTNGDDPDHSVLSTFELREPREHYLRNVHSCMEALYSGDSYELCLTTEIKRSTPWNPNQCWSFYKTLRRVNPAPYAAWLRFGGDQDLTICCSSPERFLRGDCEGNLEAKPIKGTAPRRAGATPEEDAAAAAALASSEKDRAENLMIVDLLRNDLGRVCEPGTVHVPSLMKIESFATVHQLVSTIRGQRKKDATVVDAIRAAFPGGSMTGAPKIRSMEILDSLETGPRGVYSGSLGYISVNGAFDLNIVIRTAVFHKGTVTIGAGGAIVVQSSPEEEYEEMQLKAKALLHSISYMYT